MLYQRFQEHAEQYADQIALEIGTARYTYSALEDAAQNVVQWLEQAGASKVVGILAAKSLSTYSGVLGILATRRCFIPFTKKMPPARIVDILDETGVDTLVVGEDYQELYNDIVQLAERPITCIRPEAAQPGMALSQQTGDAAASAGAPAAVEEDTAYILYTSGSTGRPKGIPVSHANVAAYLDNVHQQYDIGTGDRCSQMFDLTFDPSIHDMFVTWAAGATLVVPNANEIIAPRKFIIDRQITIFATVPSTAYFMMKTRMLRADDFPHLRYTLFTGEALPFQIFRAWQDAAPNAQIINGYGPTELTINIAAHAIPTDLRHEDCYNGIVPIGKLYGGHQMLLQSASDGKGELCVSGPQVVRGYINNQEKTEAAFFEDGARYYRTGDLVFMDEEENLHFTGRTDTQIKLRGYRVELSEIEARIKEQVRGEVIVLAWPYHEGIAQGVVAFHDDPEAVQANIVMHCKRSLPEYMIPSQIRAIPEFPLNSNGKIDRKRLLELLR